MRELKANANSCCKFVGEPTIKSKTTSRILWSGSLISEQGPTFYKRYGGYNRSYYCECYKYYTKYKWSQGIVKPPGLPGWLPWPFQYWMQTEITLRICADGSTFSNVQNATNKPKDWIPKVK